MRVVALVVRPSGFEPSALTIAPGTVQFVIINRTGIPDISYSLDNDRGASVNAMRQTTNKKDWRDILTLTPGNLVLSVPSVPRLRCSIQVTAK